MNRFSWHCGPRFRFEPGRTQVMGIVNVTPDSFSDGRVDPTEALAHAKVLLAEGADILDIGGESTRPGSHPVPPDEQLRRILPVVEPLVRAGVCLSIDTTSSLVARDCLRLGAAIINDISGGSDDPNLLHVVAEFQAGYILMHRQGTPLTMQQNPTYDDVVAEINQFFGEQLAALAQLGIKRESVALDPGIGFGKTLAHNLTLLANLDQFGHHARPLCLGVSRKGFIGQVTGRGVNDRAVGSVAVAARSMLLGADILRVHDVGPTSDAVRLDEAIHAHRG